MLSGFQLRQARRARGWSQAYCAKKLGVSQSYVAMLEAGQRPASQRLARKARQTLCLPPTSLPLPEPFEPPLPVDDQVFAEHLANLGWQPFGYVKNPHRRVLNPAEVLLTGLAQDNLEIRAVEALTWVLLQVDETVHPWLVRNARVWNLQNRLGYLTDLARRLEPDRTGLGELWEQLDASRLAAEDTLCNASMRPTMREWERTHRPSAAAHWNLLSTLDLEHIMYQFENDETES